MYFITVSAFRDTGSEVRSISFNPHARRQLERERMEFLRPLYRVNVCTK